MHYIYRCVHGCTPCKYLQNKPLHISPPPPPTTAHISVQIVTICTLIYRRIGLQKRDQAQYITGDEKNERARMCTNMHIFTHLRPFSHPPPLKHRYAGVLIEVTCTLSARNSAPPPHHSQITTQTTTTLLIDQKQKT